MSKAVFSYFDWEKQFRTTPEKKPEKKSKKKISEKNSLGVSEDAFKTLLRQWEESNL